MPFIISFNKPTGDMFFQGETVRGVEVDITSYGARFRPVDRAEGRNIVPISQRPRLNYQTNLIDGSNAEILLHSLTNPYGYDFFMITRGAGGWLEARPWAGPKKKLAPGAKPEPDRFLPNLRVWFKERSKTKHAPVSNFLAPVDETMSVIEADSVKDRLRQISTFFSQITEVPYGRAATMLREGQELLAKLEEPLNKAARVEAQTLLQASSKRRAATAEEPAKAEASAQKASQPVPPSRPAPSRTAPHGVRGFRAKRALAATA